MLLLLFFLQAAEEATSGHFRVVSTYPDREYVQAVAANLSSGYSEMVKLLGLKPGEATPYTIRLYGTQEEYVAKDKELNQGRFARNGGFSHPKTQESYVMVQPRPNAPLLDRTESLFFHEAFHLMIYRRAGWLTFFPAWLNEGLAEHAAGLCRPDSLKVSHHIALAQNTAASGKRIPLADLLSKDQSSDKDYFTRWLWYAEAHLLVKYLHEERAEAFRQFLQKLEAVPKTERSAARTQSTLLRAIGTPLKDLEDAWMRWLAALKAHPWRVIDGDWRLTKDGVEGAAFPKHSGLLVSTQVVGAEKFSLSAEVFIEKDAGGQADLLFVRASDPTGMNLWKLSFVREGFASLLVRREGAWTVERQEKFDPSKFPADRWIKLLAEVEGRDVIFLLDGEIALRHTFDDASVELSVVNWGIGNFDSWTRFRSVSLKK